MQASAARWDAGLTFLTTAREPACDGQLDEHPVGCSALQLVTSGGVELNCDDTTYTLEGAWFWPHHPGPRTRLRPAPGHATWFHRHIGFCGPRVDQWVKDGLWPAGPQPAPPGHDWGADFDLLIHQSGRSDRRGYLRAVNLLECLLLDLAEARERPDEAPQSWLLAVQAALSRGGVFTPDYAQIAQDAGVTLSTLRRRFRRATGTTMQEYALQSRLAAARSLLAGTDLSLKLIAERLGYDTVYFFARQFRQRVGVTPGRYRKSLAGDILPVDIPRDS